MADNINHQTYQGVILTGPNNITQWKHAIKIHGDAEGTSPLWRHIGLSRFLEPLIPKPDPPARPATFTRENKEVYRTDIEIYKFESQQYNRQQKRERNAKMMFIESVDDHIKVQIIDKNSRDCWKYLSNTFGVADTMAQTNLYAAMALAVSDKPAGKIPIWLGS